jgi:hypothetical protein
MTDQDLAGGLAKVSEPGTADLIGFGRIGWDQLLRMLGGAQAAWADYDGFHIGPAPAAPPPYSHLWAWTDRWLIRVRIDGGQAIAGALVLTAAPDHAPPHTTTQTVRYLRVTAHTWADSEKRVGRLAPGITGRPADVYLVSGENPVTFVSLNPPA